MTTCTVVYPQDAGQASLVDSHLARLLQPFPGFSLVNSEVQPAYDEACEFVRDRFERQFGASLTRFMPWLMSMHCLGRLSGVVGLRPAVMNGSSRPLFLEHYLDQPVELAVSAVTGESISRQGIVEIGNLVATQRGASQLVFLLMTSTLLAAGYDHMVFTATRALRSTLARLDFPLEEITRARRDQLPEESREEWGRYYDSDPVVVVARLDAVEAIIARRPLLRQALWAYAGARDHMASLLAVE